MDLREAKALEIAARFKLAFQDGYWTVPSQSGQSPYRVVLKANTADCSCTCDDFSLHGTLTPCKHILACRLVLERECGAAALAIDTDVIPKKPTYQQNWPLYTLAQETEKDRFQVLLFDLCRGIEEPPAAKTGRKRTRRSDMVFSAAFKVFSTIGARRFACDLRDAHGKGYLSNLMSSIRVCHYMEDELMTPVLQSLIVRSSLPLKALETVFAPDSTGFSTSRFVKWHDEKYGAVKSGRDWVKAHAIFGKTTNIATAVEIAGRDANDCPFFKPLVEKTAENFTVKEVPADKAYLSNENLELVEKLGGTAYVPFKSNSGSGLIGSVWEKRYHCYQYRREEFLKHYHQRSNAESGFAMIKAKFRDHVRAKTDTAMKNEVLCKFLCHNIVVVHQSQIELGIEAEFWDDAKKTGGERMILPLRRNG